MARVSILLRHLTRQLRSFPASEIREGAKKSFIARINLAIDHAIHH
jgi:hypothetical protein